MTDRELLEKAAKAAGMQLSPDGDWLSGGVWLWNERGERDDAPCLFNCHGQEWSPLHNDGDALRLAVKIGEPFVVRARCVTTMGGLIEDFNPSVPGDDLRATRRAIVRAAAATGETA